MRVAAVQLCSTPDKERNLAIVAKLAAEAVDAGAAFVALPELWNRWGSAAELREGAEALDGPSLTWAREFARDRRMHLLAGSIVERAATRLHNTSCLIDPTGEIVATYRKIHLFDVDVPGAVHRESATITPGDEVVVADAGPLRLGSGHVLRPALPRAVPRAARSAAPPRSRCRRRSRRRRARTTGSRCCAPARSRTRCS